jgi:hypothetical protein
VIVKEIRVNVGVEEKGYTNNQLMNAFHNTLKCASQNAYKCQTQGGI